LRSDCLGVGHGRQVSGRTPHGCESVGE
jgi:hypothetical protein